MTAAGEATDDPNVLKHGGSILPIGGLDHGHKGYALALLVEWLTQGLERLWPRRATERVGRGGAGAGVRAPGFRRWRGLRPGNELDDRSLPRLAARAGRGRGANTR